jgi:pyruvate formate lyase activating enzyme
LSEALGLVADVLRFSNVDGPGNRFVVFLQGCNFDCIACHNPYTINVCTDCGDCVATCPSGALTIGADARVHWDESRCTGGDTCIAVCPHDSTPKARRTSVDDLLAQLRATAPFLSGITVSGGEATVQAPFVRALFDAVKRDQRLGRLTTFVDSNGATTLDVWDDLAPVMDAAMIDLKALDPVVHQRMTGQPNDQVLASIRHLAAIGRLYEVRLLLLPGVNDDPGLLTGTAAWLRELDPATRVKVIGFRGHGVRPTTPPLQEPGPGDLARYEHILRDAGLHNTCLV